MKNGSMYVVCGKENELKTSKAEFNEFKKAFLEYVELFSLKGYRIIFEHVELKDEYAQINRDHDGRVVVVKFNLRKYVDMGSPTDEARHEAIHLLLTGLHYWASCRYVLPDQINNEEEKIVRVLEKVII